MAHIIFRLSAIVQRRGSSEERSTPGNVALTRHQHLLQNFSSQCRDKVSRHQLPALTQINSSESSMEAITASGSTLQRYEDKTSPPGNPPVSALGRCC